MSFLSAGALIRHGFFHFSILEHAEEGLVEWGFGEGFLILELGGKVDAVVLTDVTDGLGRKFLGLGRDTHGIEDGTTSL